MSEIEDSDLDSARLVPREEWGALDPRDELPSLKHPVKYVWYIYDTQSKTCNTYDECVKSMRELQRKYHKLTQLADIPFNFLIGGDGRIYEGRGWDFAPPESTEWAYTNGERIEIGYLGKKEGDEVYDKMEMACGAIVMMGKEKKYIRENVRHSEFERVGVPRLPYYEDSDEVEGDVGEGEGEGEGEGGGEDEYPEGLDDNLGENYDNFNEDVDNFEG